MVPSRYARGVVKVRSWYGPGAVEVQCVRSAVEVRSRCTLMVRSKYGRSTVEVRSWCGRGTLVVRSSGRGTLVVRSWCGRGTLEVHFRFGAVSYM